MQNLNPRKDAEASKVIYNVVPQMLNAFAAFAWNMGYESTVILDRKDRDCRIGEPGIFVQEEWSLVEHPSSGSLVDRHHRALGRNEPAIAAEEDYELRSNRCGRTYNFSYILDRPHIYLGHLATCNTEHVSRYFTSFGVKWDTILAFFGDLELDDHFENHNQLSQQQRVQLGDEGQTDIESPRRSVLDGQTDGGASSLAAPGISTTRSTIDRSDPGRYPSILPTSTVLHSWRFADTQELNTWLLHSLEGERPLLYYNMCNGWLYACGEQIREDDFRRSFRDTLPSPCYIWNVNEDGSAFVLASDAMRGDGRGIYFCGAKGSDEIDPRYWEQVVLLIARHYPAIDLADCLSMLPVGNNIVSTL